MFAPVIIFVYNRVDHFQKTIDALSKCPEAKVSELFIFSDGPKSETDTSKVQAVRNTAHAIQSSRLFKSVHIQESPVNKGLAQSIIQGVNDILEHFGRAIVLEDDCLVSSYFLSFMNRCLDAFADNPRIGAIAGYTPPIDFPKDYNFDTFIAWRSCSWTWATWKDRWQNVDWELKNIADFYADQNELYRHTRLSYLEVEAMQHKLWKYSMLSQITNFCFSFIPMATPEGVTMQVYSNGKGALVTYMALIHDVNTDEIQVSYDVQTRMVTPEQLIEFHNCYIHVIEAVLANPKTKLSDIL